MLSDQACMVLDRVIALAPVPRRETDLLIMELNKSQSVVGEGSVPGAGGSAVPDMNSGMVETSTAVAPATEATTMTPD